MGARREKKTRSRSQKNERVLAPHPKGNPKGRTKPEKLRLKFGRPTPSKGRVEEDIPDRVGRKKHVISSSHEP
jgi:hypothetical protein